MTPGESHNEWYQYYCSNICPFNLDTLKNTSNQKISAICQQFGVTQMIVEPTHFTEHSSSIIDLIFTSNKNSILLSGVGEPFLDQNVRYHCPVYFVLNFHKNLAPAFYRHIMLFDRGDYQSLSRDIRETDWESLKSNDIDIYASNITNRISELADKHIPNKKVKIRQSDPSWLTNEAKKIIRKRKRLFKKFKRTKNITDYDNYKHFRNKTTTEIRKLKQQETDKLAAKLCNNDIGPRDWWKTLKQFIKPGQSSSFPPLYKDDIIYTEVGDKATLMNNFFVAQSELDETQATLPPDITLPEHSLNFLSSSPFEVETMLKSLQLGKATGPDAINNRVLKELAKPLSFPLSDLFNFSLTSGKVPLIWKVANVTPIFKKDDPSVVSNYRPISLLSTVGKVLEKIVRGWTGGGGGGTGIEGAESGVEGAESGVEGAGSGSRGGGKRGICGRGSEKIGGRNCFFACGALAASICVGIVIPSTSGRLFI